MNRPDERYYIEQDSAPVLDGGFEHGAVLSRESVADMLTLGNFNSGTLIRRGGPCGRLFKVVRQKGRQELVEVFK